MADRRCPKCGHMENGSSFFCTECGAKFSQVTLESEADKADFSNSDIASPKPVESVTGVNKNVSYGNLTGVASRGYIPRGRRNVKLAIIAGISVLAVSAVIIFIIFIIKNLSKKDEKPKTLATYTEETVNNSQAVKNNDSDSNNLTGDRLTSNDGNLLHDEVIDKKEDKLPKIDELVIYQNNIILDIGDEYQLSTNVDAADLNWWSDDESVVSVNNGHVKAVSAGEADVLVFYGDLISKCHIVVRDSIVLANQVVRNLNPMIKKISASSTLKEKTITHKPENLLDGDKTTCWCEAGAGQGIGEYVTVTFDRTVAITELDILNGYLSKERTFDKNSKLAKITIEYSGGKINAVLDKYSYNKASKVAYTDLITFKDPLVTDYIRIYIRDTYKGSECEDTCVSELQILGYDTVYEYNVWDRVDWDSFNDEYVFYDSDSRYLSSAELAGMSKEDCKIARNEIYARRGRRFKDKQIQAYFNSKSWYSGTIDPDSFDEKVFNKFEQANKDLIVEYEETMGYR